MLLLGRLLGLPFLIFVATHAKEQSPLKKDLARLTLDSRRSKLGETLANTKKNPRPFAGPAFLSTRSEPKETMPRERENPVTKLKSYEQKCDSRFSSPEIGLFFTELEMIRI